MPGRIEPPLVHVHQKGAWLTVEQARELAGAILDAINDSRRVGDTMSPTPRKFVPDVAAIADQLVADYRTEGEYSGDIDALATMTSWLATARDHGDEFTEDDWMALVQELARRAAI